MVAADSLPLSARVERKGMKRRESEVKVKACSSRSFLIELCRAPHAPFFFRVSRSDIHPAHRPRLSEVARNH